MSYQGVLKPFDKTFLKSFEDYGVISYDLADIRFNLESYVRRMRNEVRMNPNFHAFTQHFLTKDFENYLKNRCGIKIKFVFQSADNFGYLSNKNVNDTIINLLNNIASSDNPDKLIKEAKDLRIDMRSLRAYGFPLNHDVNIYVGFLTFDENLTEAQSATIIFSLLTTLFSGLNMMLGVSKASMAAKAYAEAMEKSESENDRKQNFKKFGAVVTNDTQSINIHSDTKNRLTNMISFFSLFKKDYSEDNNIKDLSVNSLSKQVKEIVSAAGYDPELNLSKNFSTFNFLVYITNFFVSLIFLCIRAVIGAFIGGFVAGLISLFIPLPIILINIIVCLFIAKYIFSTLRTMVEDFNDYMTEKDFRNLDDDRKGFIEFISDLWQKFVALFKSKDTPGIEFNDKDEKIISQIKQSLDAVKSDSNFMSKFFSKVFDAEDTIFDETNKNDDLVSLYQGLK